MTLFTFDSRFNLSVFNRAAVKSADSAKIGAAPPPPPPPVISQSQPLLLPADASPVK